MGLADFLFGKKITTNNIQPTASYGQDIDNYLNTLSTQSYMQPLLNQPKETGLSLAQYQQGIANGLNYGVPEIAKVQDELGIRKPQTEEEIELARVGSFNQPTSLNVGVANEPRQGGFFNNFSKGFNENLNNKFQASNLEPTNKNFATRFGEGFGTLARVLDSPLGRAGLVAGVVGLTGGNPLQALTYGANTGMINQANRTADQLYRNQLKGLGMDEKDVNAIRGYITDNTYKNIADSYKARWNKANLGDLAPFNPVIAEAIKQNPSLETTYLPASVANAILKGELTQAQIANLLSQVGYRKVMGGVAQQNADTNKINAGANVSKANSYSEKVAHEIKTNPVRPERKKDPLNLGI